jgi:hypothetical protein
MKNNLRIFLSLVLTSLLCAGYSFAGDREKMVIQLKTDDFEVAETDISHLAIGESETIVTASGKTIDLLRTTEGVEIYVDGALLDLPDMNGDAGSNGKYQKIHKHMIIECEIDGEVDSEDACPEDMVFFPDGDLDIDALQADGKAHKVIIDRVHSECFGDEDGECEDHMVWVSEGEDLEFDELLEEGEGHRVIRIHKSHDGGADVETEVEKVIIIEKG